MTELVGTRSDVSNNTVAFTETAQDADIASGEKLSVLFGKIKRFSAMLAAIADRYTKLRRRHGLCRTRACWTTAISRIR